MAVGILLSSITVAAGAALNTSLSNYVAYITDGVDPWDMDFNESQDYNPYRDTDINWLSILSYSGGVVNPLYTINPDFNPNRPVNADNPVAKKFGIWQIKIIHQHIHQTPLA